MFLPVPVVNTRYPKPSSFQNGLLTDLYGHWVFHYSMRKHLQCGRTDLELLTVLHIFSISECEGDGSWNTVSDSLSCDMTPESRNYSLLGNVSINIFSRQRTRATTEERCFLWSAPFSLLRIGVVNTSLQQ
jgi:hypothetical protein